MYIARVDRRVSTIMAPKRPNSRPVTPHRMTLQMAAGGMRNPMRTPMPIPTTTTAASTHGSHENSAFVKV
jgi:hypothetical protein